MVHEPELWALVVVDRAEATLGLLRGKRIETLRNKQSLVPSKHGRGGQSAHRFERLIEHAAHEFFVRVAEMCTELYLPRKDELKGILLGGPGATKEFFFKEGFLQVRAPAEGRHAPLRHRLHGRARPQGAGREGDPDSPRARAHGREADHPAAPERDPQGGDRPRGLRGARRRARPRARRRRDPAHLRRPAAAEDHVPMRLLPAGVPPVPGGFGDRRGPRGPLPELRRLPADRGSLGGLRRGTVPPGGRVRASARLVSTESEEGEMLAKAFQGVAALLRYPVALTVVLRPRTES